MKGFIWDAVERVWAWTKSILGFVAFICLVLGMFCCPMARKTGPTILERLTGLNTGEHYYLLDVIVDIFVLALAAFAFVLVVVFANWLYGIAEVARARTVQYFKKP